MARTLGLKNVFSSKYKSLNIPTILHSRHTKAEREVLVDSGATDNFISEKLLKRMKIGKLSLKKPRYIWNIDGTHNKSGSIKEYVDLQVQVGPKKEEMHFLVTHIGEDELVLGYPWLAAFQPKIDWKNAVLDETQQPLVIKTLGLRCYVWASTGPTDSKAQAEGTRRRMDQEQRWHHREDDRAERGLHPLCKHIPS